MNPLINHLPKFIGNKLVNMLSHNNQGDSKLLREYYKQKFHVDVDLYSYGGCFQPDFNIGGIKVKIGSYCSFGGNIHYFGANHPMAHITTSAYFYNKNFSGFDVVDVPRTSLIISDDVWIGYGVIITAGCKKIGRGSVIGAGSIITKNVEPYTIVAGNPAKMIRKRFKEDEIRMLEESQWWKKSPQELYQYYPLMNNVRKFVEEITRN